MMRPDLSHSRRFMSILCCYQCRCLQFSELVQTAMAMVVSLTKIRTTNVNAACGGRGCRTLLSFSCN